MSSVETPLDKVVKVATVISLIAVPIVVMTVGYRVDYTLSKAETSQGYVELAVAVLTSKESSENLRDWALEIINTTSPSKVALDRNDAKELILIAPTSRRLPPDIFENPFEDKHQDSTEDLGRELPDDVFANPFEKNTDK